MAPAAKPSRIFCNSSGMAFFMKKTKADPSAVPRKGIRRAINTAFIGFAFFCAKLRFFGQPDNHQK